MNGSTPDSEQLKEELEKLRLAKEVLVADRELELMANQVTAERQAEADAHAREVAKKQAKEKKEIQKQLEAYAREVAFKKATEAKKKRKSEVKATEREPELVAQSLPVKDGIKKVANRSVLWGVLSFFIIGLGQFSALFLFPIGAVAVAGAVSGIKALRHSRSHSNPHEVISVALFGIVLNLLACIGVIGFVFSIFSGKSY
ncbi:MAG: hypothetical protein GY915_04495 [bacterium]|nr:hypothetical protein [bacterium]